VRLLLAEVRRLLARRAVVILLVTGFVLSVVVSGAVLWNGRPIGADDLAAAQAQLEQSFGPRALQRMERDVAQCEENPRRYGGGPGFDCEQIRPQAEDFIGREVLEPRSLRDYLLIPLTLLLGLLSLIAGTTFVGAEYASGSMSNLLLFEPRRGRVWAAKVAAVLVVTTAFAVLVLGIAMLVSFTAAVAWSDVSWTGADSWHAAYATARGIAVVVASAVVGVAMTLAVRATIATVGLVLGYALVGETLLRAVAQQAVEPWLLGSNLVAFLRGRLVLRDYSEVTGRGRPDVTVLHVQTSAYYLGALLLALLLVTWVTFRRRDVT
jgi:ABC-2 type transport system permease protein